MKSHLSLGGKGEGSKPRLRSELRMCLALKKFKTGGETIILSKLESKVERTDMHVPPFFKQNSIKWPASASGGNCITYKPWACLCQIHLAGRLRF